MLWSTELVLETLNSSVNVIIYAIFNKKFRMLFAEMFCCSYFKTQENSTQESLALVQKQKPFPSPVSMNVRPHHNQFL